MLSFSVNARYCWWYEIVLVVTENRRRCVLTNWWRILLPLPAKIFAKKCMRPRRSCRTAAVRNLELQLCFTEMVNGSRYYRALESVSIASALSTALTIYPCQIRVLQRWQPKLQLPTARKKEWRPATADSSPQPVTCQHCDIHYFSRPRIHNLPIVGPTRYQ